MENNIYFVAGLILLSILVVSTFFPVGRCTVDGEMCRDTGCDTHYQCIRNGKGTNITSYDYQQSVWWVESGFCDEINPYQSCGCDCSMVRRNIYHGR